MLHSDIIPCDFNDIRNKHFIVSPIKNLFGNVSHRTSLIWIILSKKPVLISNFNVFKLMLVIYFLF